MKTFKKERAMLVNEIQHTFESLYTAIGAFSEAETDIQPFAGSWSAGQVAEHLIKGMSGIGRLGTKTEKSDRPLDEKIPAIKKMFLDYSIRLTSPDFLVPTSEKHDIKAQLSELKAIEEQHRGMAEDADLSLESRLFELPGFGALTLYEWISFNLIHAQRHTLQLQNIRKKM
ncbi:DinB family protein [Flavobacterium pallidum]|uniref:DinB family protein n=1 Tax=Flavobacterium pallidum TaxID=2172098 RepID=A0A2S1SHA2_9FLAO|nr:DinB family protein [Flavobacterium pallidum]AWI25722.1 DinB family protein [Flavobacterium pallidum]